MEKQLFIIKTELTDDGPEFEVVESTSAAKALMELLTETFPLDDEDEREEYVCEDMMRDECFGVAKVAVGAIEFEYYYNLQELKDELKK